MIANRNSHLRTLCAIGALGGALWSLLSSVRPADPALPYCPYCGGTIHRTTPERAQRPPDERTMHRPSAAIKCRQLHPCRHVFREADLAAVETGALPAAALGERVENPAGGRV
jgi:hypothetical protein